MAKKGYEKSTGWIGDEIIDLQNQLQLQKKQLALHKSVPSKARKTKEVLLGGKRMPINSVISKLDDAIEAQEHQIKSYTDELEGLRTLSEIDDPMLGDVMEWQNFYNFTPRQREALDVYNATYLKFMQREFVRGGTPQKELQHVLTGRSYFPRASSEVLDAMRRRPPQRAPRRSSQLPKMMELVAEVAPPAANAVREVVVA